MSGRLPWSFGRTHTAISCSGAAAAFICQKKNSAGLFTDPFGGCCMDLPASSLRGLIAILGAIALTAGAYLLSSGLHRLWWPARAVGGLNLELHTPCRPALYMVLTSHDFGPGCLVRRWRNH